MKTIFLAAGTSSRMTPISDKNFLPFLGKPLIYHLLKNAQEAGCYDFVIVGNEGNKAKIETLKSQEAFLETAEIVVQGETPGMAGGILAALEVIGDEEPILILNGNDHVLPTAIKSVINTGGQNDGAILGQVRDQYFPGGYLNVDDSGKIESIIEKPGEGNEPSNLVNIVIHYIARAGDLKNSLSEANSQNDDVYEVALDHLFKTKNFQAVTYEGPWQAIKYPWHVLDMMRLFLANQETLISTEAQISQSATIKGERVVIEAGAKVFENAVICGPCYIGKGAIVGNGALVRHAHIGAGSTVGYNTEVARSWLGYNVTTHIAYIGDSIVDDGVNFGAYSCTANLRLDQKSVRVNIKDEKVDSNCEKLGCIVGMGAQIGVGAKLMPGSKVEQNTHIRPNEVWF